MFHYSLTSQMETIRQIVFYKNYFDSIPVSPLLKEISFRDARIYAGDDLMRYIWLHPVMENGQQTSRDISDQYIAEVKKLISGEKNDIMASEYPGFMREFAIPARKSES